MDLDALIYNGMTNSKVGERGEILIAEPLLTDPWFGRSVVLMLDRDKEGGRLGLTMNKVLPLSLADLFPDWPEASAVKVYQGGPVDRQRLFMLHTLGDAFGPSAEVCPGVYVGGETEKIMDYINRNLDTDGKVRFFMGYSGWTDGQLEGEIARKSWAVARPDTGSRLLEGEGDAYWRREVSALGEPYRAWLSVPENPMFN